MIIMTLLVYNMLNVHIVYCNWKNEEVRKQETHCENDGGMSFTLEKSYRLDLTK